MSNLSELLPTGGGQNAVDFVASGTLSSGQTVALKADGTVEAVAGNAEGVGTPVEFSSNFPVWSSGVFDSSSNKIVLAYYEGATTLSSSVVVGTVSGTSISFGTPVVFESGEAASISLVFDSNENKVVIVYTDVNNSRYGTARVGTVSGTSISLGSSVIFESATSYYTSAAFDSNSNKIVIAYRDNGNSSYGTAIVGTVSGTSISFGSPVIFESSAAYYESCSFDSTSNKIVIAYATLTPENGRAVVGTVSGSTISFGTPVTFNSAFIQLPSASFNAAQNKTVIAYKDFGNSSYSTAIVGTVSGTSISFGSPVVFESVSSQSISSAYASNIQKTIIGYTGTSTNGKAILGTISGTSISFDTATVLSTFGQYVSTTFDSANNKTVFAYKNNASIGFSVVYATASTNNTSFIGITAEAISDTATGAVNVYGGINEAQTGLTIGSDYYVQNDGSISTTSSAVKIGQAISATTINMMDLT